MCAQMSSPGDKQPPKEWWFENACRIAAFRLRNEKYLGVNVTPYVSKSVMPWSLFASFGRRSTGTSRRKTNDEVEPRQSTLQRVDVSALREEHRCTHVPAVYHRCFEADLSQRTLCYCVCVEAAEQRQALARTASLQRLALSLRPVLPGHAGSLCKALWKAE